MSANPSWKLSDLYCTCCPTRLCSQGSLAEAKVGGDWELHIRMERVQTHTAAANKRGTNGLQQFSWHGRRCDAARKSLPFCPFSGKKRSNTKAANLSFTVSLCLQICRQHRVRLTSGQELLMHLRSATCKMLNGALASR